MPSQYNLGTVSVVYGSQIVTGEGTSWTGQINVGDMLLIDPAGPVGIVASVQSDTSLTLEALWSGTDATGAAYAVHRDFDPVTGTPLANIGDKYFHRLFNRAVRVLGDLPLRPFVTTGASALRFPADRGADLVFVKDFGAVLDGVTDDTAAFIAANAAANGRQIVVNGVAHLETHVTLTSPIFDTFSQIFTISSQVTLSGSQYVRPDWWGDVEGSLNYAVDALPETGGVIKLRARTYKPNGHRYGFDSSGTCFSKQNVTFDGEKMPRLSNDCRYLTGGTIIQGMVIAYADNIEFRNLGVDSGKVVVDYYADGFITPGEWEGLVLTYPDNASKNASEVRLNGRLHNVIGLSYSPSSLTHAVIVGEGYSNVTCSGEIVGCYGVHGIVIKCAELKADQLTAYCNDSEGVIIKSDSQSSAMSIQVQIGRIKSLAGGPIGYNPYIKASNGFGVMVNPQGGNVGFVQIDSIFTSGHPYGVSIAAAQGYGADAIQIGKIITEHNWICGVSLVTTGHSFFDRSSIGSILARNTGVGVYAGAAIQGLVTVDNLHVVNAQVAVDASGTTNMNFGTIIAESCSIAAMRNRESARPIIGELIATGTTSVLFTDQDGGLVPSLINGWRAIPDIGIFGLSYSSGRIQYFGIVVPGTANALATVPFWARPVRPKRFLLQGKKLSGSISSIPVVVGTDGVIAAGEVPGDFSEFNEWLALDGISYTLTS